MDESPKEEQPQKPRRSHSFELIVAAAFGVLALAVLLWQVLRVSSQPHTTETEALLFNILQFVLTVLFSWLSTRALSQLEFEQSLKRFAISAYRRVADIERMVGRLQSEIKGMISDAPKNETLNLRIVEAIVSDTTQVVRSSISDWGDVIGDELLAIEKIKRLEREKAELRKAEPSERSGLEIDKARQQIEKSIAAIASKLPARLRLEAGTQRDDEYSVWRASRKLAIRHEREGGLLMTAVRGGKNYPHEGTLDGMASGTPLEARKTQDGSMDVVDDKGNALGRLLNETELQYDPFVAALDLCYGSTPVQLQFVRMSRERVTQEGEHLAWFDIRVTSALKPATAPPRRQRVQ
jgi:hypothetical protein